MSGVKNTSSRSVLSENQEIRWTSASSGSSTGSKKRNVFCSGWK